MKKLLFSIGETFVFLGRNHLLRYSNRAIPEKNISRMIAINYRNMLNLVTFA